MCKKTTHVAEIFVKQFDVSMNDFQRQKLVVLAFNAAAKIQAGVPVNIFDNIYFISHINAAKSTQKIKNTTYNDLNKKENEKKKKHIYNKYKARYLTVK